LARYWMPPARERERGRRRPRLFGPGSA
jgi:hypothetical protein